LAAWGDEQASAHDRPRRWILDDAALIELTRRMPKTVEDLQRIRGLPSATVQRHGEMLLARIAAARAEPPEQWPIQSRRPILTSDQAAQVDDRLTLIAMRANQYNIPIRPVANREAVERLLAGEDSPLRHGWRAALVGRELQAGVGGDSSH